MSSTRTLVVVALAGCLVLAGCGASGPSATPAGQQTATSTSATPTTTGTTTQIEAPNGTLSVHFINVGQSVSTLIIGPTGETMLVDTGNYVDDGEYVLQYLQRHDIDRLDHLVVSHNDADHIGGNAVIIDYYETQANGVGAVYDPGIAASTQTYQAYLDAVEEHGVTLYETREGDRIPFEDVTVDVLGPPDPYLENEARNENSIVLKLTFGTTSLLLTGDAEKDQETYLVDTYGSQLQATILKAGHHGSRSSTSEELLDAVDPQAVVISSAYDSQYGHPHQETLQRLSTQSISTYWTATHGTVVFRSDGRNVTIATQRSAPTAPLSLRDANAIDPGTATTITRRATLTGERVMTVTPVVTDGGTTPSATTPTNGLRVVSIHADAAGDERGNLADEYIIFENTDDETLDLSGWQISDAAGATYTVPNGVTLDPDEQLTLHTGSGIDTETDLYWGSSQPVWNNGGDTIIVSTANDEPVLTETYP